MNCAPSQFQNRFRKTAVLMPLAIVGAAIVANIARFCLETGLTWRCPSMALFGIPCPGCGSTRALAALSHFHFVDALRFNPLIVTTLALVLLAPLLKISWENFERRGWRLFGVAVGLNWLYLLFFLPR
jgi:hypothetical protein